MINRALYHKSMTPQFQQIVKENKQKTTSASFAEWINYHMKNERFFDHKIKFPELAMLLGFPLYDSRKATETIKKIVNNTGYTTSRDRIILICLALKMTASETNRALFLYEMLPLNENDARERNIILALDKELEISELNEWLSEKGLETLTFEVQKKKYSISKNVPIELYTIEEDIQFHVGDFVGDTSISGRFNPENYIINATMILKHKETKELFQLEIDQKGYYTITKLPIRDLHSAAHYSNLQDINDSELQMHFQKMEVKLTNKYRQFLSILDDTRNYQYRIDLDIYDGKPSTFIETFNYLEPENPEYYQLIVTPNETKMTVSSCSLFLQHHLGEHYYDFYASPKHIVPSTEYHTVEEIKNLKLTSYKKELLCTAFLNLQSIYIDTFAQIRDQKLKVCDSDSYLSDWFEIADFYHIQDYFTWETDEKYGEEYPTNFFCDFVDPDGSTHKLSLKELREALSLGIFTLQDYLSIKQKYSSIYEIFQ